jgi:hypothetical protein
MTTLKIITYAMKVLHTQQLLIIMLSHRQLRYYIHNREQPMITNKIKHLATRVVLENNWPKNNPTNSFNVRDNERVSRPMN